jgi:hypothetical protein
MSILGAWSVAPNQYGRCQLEDEVRDELIRRFAAETPEIRMNAFGMALAAEVGGLPAGGITRLLGPSFASVAVALLHTAMRHPEWAMAVVDDSQYFVTLTDIEGTPETYEEAMEFITELYPMAPRYTNKEDYDERVAATQREE